MDSLPTYKFTGKAVAKTPSNSLALRVLLVMMLIVTLSCTILSSGSDNEDTSLKDTEIALGVQQTLDAKAAAEPTATPTQAPTEPPPTSAPATEQVYPTEAAEPEGDVELVSAMINQNASAPGDVYYLEDFDGMEGWWVYPLRGEETGWGYEVINNHLRTEIVSQDTWVYYMFEGGGDFQDIRIDITVENRASNTNFVGIICRSSDNGWYEANILNTGEYYIYYGYPDEASVDLMHKGATRLIKTGKSINSYAMTCKGDLLTLEINGVEDLVIPLKSGIFNFLEQGQVGVSVSTSYVIPVMVDFLEFVMSVP